MVSPLQVVLVLHSSLDGSETYLIFYISKTIVARYVYTNQDHFNVIIVERSQPVVTIVTSEVANFQFQTTASDSRDSGIGCVIKGSCDWLCNQRATSAPGSTSDIVSICPRKVNTFAGLPS
jgi:hypothetical protein